jgi:hypothetical protein
MLDRQTAAFSSWHFPHTYTPEQVAAGEAELKVPTEWTPGTVNVELNEEFFGKLFEGRRKNLVRDDMYCRFSSRSRSFIVLVPSLLVVIKNTICILI